MVAFPWLVLQTTGDATAAAIDRRRHGAAPAAVDAGRRARSSTWSADAASSSPATCCRCSACVLVPMLAATRRSRLRPAAPRRGARRRVRPGGPHRARDDAARGRAQPRASPSSAPTASTRAPTASRSCSGPASAACSSASIGATPTFWATAVAFALSGAAHGRSPGCRAAGARRRTTRPRGLWRRPARACRSCGATACCAAVAFLIALLVGGLAAHRGRRAARALHRDRPAGAARPAHHGDERAAASSVRSRYAAVGRRFSRRTAFVGRAHRLRRPRGGHGLPAVVPA